MIYNWQRYLTFQQLKKKKVIEVWATKKFHKRLSDRMGRYSLAYFWENCKKVMIEVNFLKNAPICIDLSSNFVYKTCRYHKKIHWITMIAYMRELFTFLKKNKKNIEASKFLKLKNLYQYLARRRFKILMIQVFVHEGHQDILRRRKILICS